MVELFDANFVHWAFTLEHIWLICFKASWRLDDQDLSTWPRSQHSGFKEGEGLGATLRVFGANCDQASRIRWVAWSWLGKVPFALSRSAPPSTSPLPATSTPSTPVSRWLHPLIPVLLDRHTPLRRWLLRLQTGVRPCPLLGICKLPSLGRARPGEDCQLWRLSEIIIISSSGCFQTKGSFQLQIMQFFCSYCKRFAVVHCKFSGLTKFIKCWL